VGFDRINLSNTASNAAFFTTTFFLGGLIGLRFAFISTTNPRFAQFLHKILGVSLGLR
jgi:hypothetical protein